MTGHLLEVVDLTIDFVLGVKKIHAVAGISYHLDRGETLAILGESGSGKSVQATAIMGILDMPPARLVRGGVRFDGQDLLALPPEQRRDLAGRRIAMIFQDPLAHLNPVYPVGWQIAEALTAHGADTRHANAEARALMERVGIPDAARRMADYPHQFSGGQRQRVMIAMAMAMKPDLLIADEPTTALDVTVQARILELLRSLQDETGMGILLITHDLGVVAETADRVAVMTKGQIVETGSVAEIFANPQDPYTQRLLAAIPGKRPFGDSATKTSPTLLEISGVAKYFPITKGLMRRATGEVVKAVDGIDLQLARGEALGIVGESGSGKSTLARMILLLEEPTAGEIHFDGVDITNLDDNGLLAYRRKVQVVFQDPYASLNPRMTVFEIIAEPWMIHRGVLDQARWRSRVLELLDQVGMEPAHADRYPHQFSGGQRQRIAIARALALQPELIICDEAVSALDVSIQAQVIELLAELRSRLHLSMIFIAHDLPVVRDIADRVIVMQSGKVVETGDVRQIFERPEHPYTKQLLAASPDPEAIWA